jgi:hypothetical protein
MMPHIVYEVPKQNLLVPNEVSHLDLCHEEEKIQLIEEYLIFQIRLLFRRVRRNREEEKGGTSNRYDPVFDIFDGRGVLKSVEARDRDFDQFHLQAALPHSNSLPPTNKPSLLLSL